MLPIARHDVEKALDEIDRDGVPRKYCSRLYCVVARHGRHYPPKQVLRLAYRSRDGSILTDFRGGKQTNTPLQLLGYTVERCVKAPQCHAGIAVE
jgi:hypothetical protein